ncbi:retrotransposon protein, putative, ty1-copia subclass [Tanacetum coccineum]
MRVADVDSDTNDARGTQKLIRHNLDLTDIQLGNHSGLRERFRTRTQTFKVESYYGRRNGFSEEEQDLGISRSSSWSTTAGGAAIGHVSLHGRAKMKVVHKAPSTEGQELVHGLRRIHDKGISLYGLSKSPSNGIGGVIAPGVRHEGARGATRRFWIDQETLRNAIDGHFKLVVQSARGPRLELCGKFVVSRYLAESQWKAAMKEEMDSLRKNKTWELVDHPTRQKLVSCIWQFKIKEGIEGVQKPRYKARLVARGFTQRAGIDYNEVFSPVVRHISIQVILALTACKDYELEHLDVKTAFLNGNLEEVIYMKQPPGYEQGNKIGSTKSLLKKEFDMKELGEAKEDSGYGDHHGKSVKMPLSGHFKLSLKDCSVKDCDVERMSKVPYANAVGSLIYLMVCTWPDIEYAGTTNVGLVYGTNHGNHVDVRGFVDSDYANDPDKGRKMLKSKTTMKNPTSQHAENYSLHSYAMNQPTFYRDHQTQPPLPVEFSSKSLKVSVDRGHFLEGVERLFSAWATRFNDNEKVQQVRVNS